MEHTKIVTVEKRSRHAPWQCSKCFVGAFRGLVASTCSIRVRIASFWPALTAHERKSQSLGQEFLQGRLAAEEHIQWNTHRPEEHRLHTSSP